MPNLIVTELRREDRGRAAEFLHVYYNGRDECGEIAAGDDARASDHQTILEISANGKVFEVWAAQGLSGIAGYTRIPELSFSWLKGQSSVPTAGLRLMAIDEDAMRMGAYGQVIEAISEDLQRNGIQKLQIDISRHQGALAAFLESQGEGAVEKKQWPRLVRPIMQERYTIDVERFLKAAAGRSFGIARPAVEAAAQAVPT